MKNVRIELWRFLFAVYMVVYHVLGHVYNKATGGYIGVDVFFIISGYFLASAYNKKSIPTHEYFINRFMRLWPMYIAAYLISLVCKALRTQGTIANAVEWIYKSFPEMFMLKVSVSVNGVSWYVAALLIASLVWWLLFSARRQVTAGGGLLAAVLIYSRFIQESGQIHYITSSKLFTFGYDGVWRAIAGIGLGIFGYAVSQKLKEQRISGKTKYVIGLCGNAMMALIVVASFFKHRGMCDFWFIFLAFCAVICLTVSEGSGVPFGIKGTTRVLYLGGLAYPIYLVHEAIYGMFKTYCFIPSVLLGCVATIFATLVVVVLLQYILKKTTNYFSSKWKLCCLSESGKE